MRKLKVSTLVTLDGVIQDPGGFGETAQGGWASPYFTADAQRNALEQMLAADYFLTGRVTYELLRKTWGAAGRNCSPKAACGPPCDWLAPARWIPAWSASPTPRWAGTDRNSHSCRAWRDATARSG